MSYIIISIALSVLVLIKLLFKNDKNQKKENIKYQTDGEVLSMIAVKGYEDKVINRILNGNVSGIIINCDSPDTENLEELINKIKRKIKRKIFIALDQDRKSTYSAFYNQNFKVYPSYIGEKKSSEYAYKIAYERAVKLKSMGVNTILGPICNIRCGEKSNLKENVFSKDEELTAELVYYTVKAQKDAGMITALKYFPEYYDDEFYIDKNVNHIYKKPFLSGIKAKADIIVMPHIKDGKIYRDILINDMGFNGIIMTDYINDGKNIINYGINVFTENYFNKVDIKNLIDADKSVCLKILKLMEKL